MAKSMNGHAAMRQEKNFQKRMSDHIAIALIVYTLLLIFVVTPAMTTSSMSILPYFLLVLLVALMIPFSRKLDRRWKGLMGSELSGGSLQTRFNLDRTKLWIVTLAVPFGLAFLFRLM